MTGIWQWTETHERERPDKVAIRFEGHEISYGELARRVREVSGWLMAVQGLERGDRIAYLGYNTPEQIVLTLAAARAGLMVAPINWRLAPPEQAAIIADAGAKLVLYQTGFATRAADILAGWTGGKALPVAAMAEADGFDGEPVGEESDPLLLVYTSGTTGEPKGAVLSQRAVAMNALNSIHMHDMTAEDRILTVLPMFHVGGLNIQTLPALSCGATVSLHQRFDAALTLRAIRHDRPSLTVQVPATLTAMMRNEMWAAADLSSLRAIATGSTDVPVPLIEAWHARGVPVIQVYGSTETAPCCLYQRAEEAFETVGSIGRCGLHSTIRIARADGSEAEAGEEGEIWVGGGTVASGYWNNPEQTATTFAGGWFRSGDVALKDADGLYWFRDRIRNVIISGGENIYPAELERVLRAVPGLAEASVVGVPDRRWGSVPVVAAVKGDPALDEATVLKAFHGKLARYKHPKRVVFIDALPRNVMGKVVVEEVKKLVE